jgi:hypothetical protein
MVDYEDNDKAYKLLKKMYYNWKENNAEYKFDTQKYSRYNLTKELVHIFDDVLK